ncbi:DEAD/DEAH box helicase [Aquimarina sp. I32.4]|uniref:DEAD/DEAH box helicase n=1 Tax=Aquimarina sp. I32.4 TaxID=2053903 RepID=UPI000CDF1BAF|nr:DEAD/DEAH box helicase [Aquimarina sp. I32.4]
MDEIIANIEEIEALNFEKSFEYAQLCSSLLNSNEEEGRKLIINILNQWDKIHPSTHEIWTDLVEAAGFYPYLEKSKDQFSLFNISGALRKELQLSSNLSNKYFHDDQFKLLGFLHSDKNVVVSAPTSFGKSLLIEEIVASKKHTNIVIIQPTLALLDETRRKLLNYKDDYKLIIRTSQESVTDRGNIFLFTAERVNEYQNFPKVDFLVIDEFYKLSGVRDDERSSSLNNAFHFLLKSFNPKFYLLGPNIDGISPGFIKKYNAVFFKSDYSLVDSRSVDIYSDHDGEFGSRGKKAINKERVLFDLLRSQQLSNEQTIIYCSSPGRVRKMSKKFTEYLIEKSKPVSIEKYPLTEWVQKNVSEDWSLLKNLNYNIGIHDGALQKHITSSIIDYFNNGQLKYLFCTSTIIEGVNTSAKNIIYYDEHKGLKPNGGPKKVDFFDYSNIKGRAGRMMEHYVGKIYNFNPPPPNEKIIVDIPFFQQNPIKDEVLIQLDKDELLEPNSPQNIAIGKIPEIERAIIKKNGVKVHGQKTIFDILRTDIGTNYELISWTGKPKYKQLSYVLKLAWDNLLVEGETVRPMTLSKLVKMTFDYGIEQKISVLIANDYTYKRGLDNLKKLSDSDVRDLAIQETFQIIKHWFQYKIPKWLSVINEIQRFICGEFGFRPGNYTYYSNLIENDFLRENLTILAEYGIPSSAIKKIQDRIPESINQDDVLKYIDDNELYQTRSLLDYEKQKIKENL